MTQKGLLGEGSTGGFGGRNEATMGGVGLQRVAATRKVGGFN